jgi:hypothetical protein
LQAAEAAQQDAEEMEAALLQHAAQVGGLNPRPHHARHWLMAPAKLVQAVCVFCYSYCYGVEVGTWTPALGHPITRCIAACCDMMQWLQPFHFCGICKLLLIATLCIYQLRMPHRCPLPQQRSKPCSVRWLGRPSSSSSSRAQLQLQQQLRQHTSMR